MEDLFVTYQLSFDLKELGFNEPCFGKYTIGVYHPNFNQDRTYILDLEMGLNETFDHNKNEWFPTEWCSAPLYQQAFAFFREKYNLDGSMSVDVWNKKTTSYRITGGIEGVVEASSYGDLYDIDSKDYDTYEDARLECLKKLIEIVKEQK
jgi:hypothetical protein